MTSLRQLKKRFLADARVAKQYDRLEPEFAVARALIGARKRAGLTQAEIARRMGTTQAAISRMESGRQLPSTRSLVRFAQATTSRIRIVFVR